MPSEKIKWALIVMGDYKLKFKVKAYEVYSSQINITAEDGSRYITSMSNALIMDKEPVLKR